MNALIHRRRPLILLLGLAALSIAVTASAIAWAHRTEWFVIRPLWRRALELQALRQTSPRDAAFQPTELRELSPFDVTLSRLVRAQEPGCLGFKDVSIFKLRSWDLRISHVIVGEPLPGNAFDQAPGDDVPEIIRFPSPWRITALDSSGHILQPASWTAREDNGSVIVDPAGREVLALESYRGCPHGTTSRLGKKLFAADSKGLVPLGHIVLMPLWAPSCLVEGGISGKCDPAEIKQLINSGSEGNAHRALSRLEEAPTTLAPLAVPLLESPDGFTRARAVAIVGRHGLSRPGLERFAADPDPRVRIAAICPLSQRTDRRPVLVDLAKDLDPVVAQCARDRLARLEGLEGIRKVPALPEDD